jgi:hypothetical protein
MANETWSATITQDGSDLQLRVVQTLRMAPDVARQLAAQLLLAAERTEQDPQRMTIADWSEDG